VEHFPKSSAPNVLFFGNVSFLVRFFFCKCAGLSHHPSENMMIIRGLADFGAEPYRSFFEILGNRMTDFPESSAPAPLIF
jgi:hypothetical protein